MQELHHQVQEFFILKGAFKLYDPGVVRRDRKDVTLGLDVFLLVLEDHFVFLHLFYCHNLVRLFVPANADFSESASPDNLQGLIVVNKYFGTSIESLVSAGVLTVGDTVRPPCAGSLA